MNKGELNMEELEKIYGEIPVNVDLAPITHERSEEIKGDDLDETSN